RWRLCRHHSLALLAGRFRRELWEPGMTYWMTSLPWRGSTIRSISIPFVSSAQRCASATARRLAPLLGLTALAWGSSIAQPQPATMTLDLLTELARQRAAGPYDAQARRVPDFLNDLGYDQYRDFRFRHERAYWHGADLPFELEFFHPG